ncbi:GH32 C-terminal domain-containing protein [Streptomyces sp. NPDC004647]|uniref:GH32 C-terminal domain-containing protein n=1 Tax=Streptomyces sp. NPDC004647 TaxID=3154671 RepID=UPI0033A18241
MPVTPGEAVELGRVDGVADLRVRLGFGREAAWGLRIATSADGAECLDMEIRNGRLTVDRGPRLTRPAVPRRGVRMPLPEAEPGRTIELRVLLDRSITEVFTDSGETLTLRFYPTGGGPWTLLSRGLAAGDVHLDPEAYTLRTP